MTHNSTQLKGSKKKLEPRLDPKSRLYVIRYNNGGEVPGELSGKYSSAGIAQTVIDMYLSKR